MHPTGPTNSVTCTGRLLKYNFYIQFYEKDTGLGAFEMLIWRRCVSIAFSGICGIRVFFILRRRKHSRLIIHFKSSINEV